MPDQQSHMEAVDGGGEESIDLNAFQSTPIDEDGVPCPECPECPEVPVPDTTPPVVSGFVPAPGTQLGLHDPVQFDVTDTSGSLRAVIAAVAFTTTGAVELAYDGTEFTPRYRNSTVQPIANGYRFSLRRVGGWAGDSIDVKVIAVDPSGNLDE